MQTHKKIEPLAAGTACSSGNKSIYIISLPTTKVKLWMSEEEITESFRQSGYADKQINIISQLSLMRPSDVVKVLIMHNLPVSERVKNKHLNGMSLKVRWTKSKNAKFNKLRADGKSFPEIAEVFGCSPIAAKNHYYAMKGAQRNDL